MLAAALRRARRAAQRRARRAPAQPRRLGVDVVAPGHAREAVAGEQHDVQQRRREADQGLDAAAVGELALVPMVPRRAILVAAPGRVAAGTPVRAG